MLKQNYRAKLSGLLKVAVPVVVVDQLTKALVLAKMPLYRTYTVVPDFLSLTHIQNPGGAFGFLAAQPLALRSIVFFAMSMFAVILVTIFYWRTPPAYRLLATSFALILGGAVGNIIDRVRFGSVVDFIYLHAGSLHWPAFNVADSAITVGMVVLVAHLFMKKMPD